jgi:hypothetical protein
MERLEALYEEWKEEPPIAPWVLGYLGFKPPGRSQAVNAAEIFNLFPTGVISIEGLAPAMPAIH